VIATIAVLSVGIATSSAQDTPTLTAADGNVSIAELTDRLAERDAQIAVLEQQLAFTRQAAIQGQARVDNQRETILAFQEAGRFSPAAQEDAMEAWRIGYAIGGGRSLAAFENVILPCESGGEPDPDAAIGPTDDWGRAQINRPTWSGRFEELTGMQFEDWIRDPVLNGYMAARVEAEHRSGLSAWTCWRTRG